MYWHSATGADAIILCAGKQHVIMKEARFGSQGGVHSHFASGLIPACAPPDPTTAPTTPPTTSAVIRLADGNATSGRLEVKVNGQWGTVSDDGFGVADAMVACRTLGFVATSSDDASYTSARTLAGRAIVGNTFSTLPILMDNVHCPYCSGQYDSCTDFLACTYSSTSGQYDSHGEDVILTCDNRGLGLAPTAAPTAAPTSPTSAPVTPRPTAAPTTPSPTGTYGASYGTGTVRLIGPSAAEGRLEVYRDGRWGSVCDRHRNVRTVFGGGGWFNSNYNCTNDDCFGPAEGLVFCRQLGWSDYVSGTLPPGALANTAVPEGNQMENRPRWYANLLPTDCSGDESRWEECPVVKDYRRLDRRRNCVSNGLQPVTIGDCEAAVTSTSISSCRDQPGIYCKRYSSSDCWRNTVTERCPALCGECTQPPTTAPSTSAPLTNASVPTAVTVVSSDQIAPGCTTHRVDDRDRVVWNANATSTAQCGVNGSDCLCFDPDLTSSFYSGGDGGETLMVLYPAGCHADDDVWLTCGGNHSNTMSPTLTGQTYAPSGSPSTSPPSAAPTQWAFAAATVRLVGGNVTRCQEDFVSGGSPYSSSGAPQLGWSRRGYAVCGEVAGRLEVKINGTWGSVTSATGPGTTAFGDDEARIFCRQLGWSEAVPRTGDGAPTLTGASPTEFTGGTANLSCAAHHLGRDSLCAALLPPLVQDINCHNLDDGLSGGDSQTLPPSPSPLDRWQQCTYTERSINSFGDAGVGYPHSCTPGCDQAGQQGIYLACTGTYSTGSPTAPTLAPSLPPTTSTPSEQGATFSPAASPTTLEPTTSRPTTVEPSASPITSIPTEAYATLRPTLSQTTLAPTPVPTITSSAVKTTTAPVATPAPSPAVSPQPPSPPPTTFTTTTIVVLYFPGDLATTSAVDQTTLIAAIDAQLSAAYGAASVRPPDLRAQPPPFSLLLLALRAHTFKRRVFASPGPDRA